MRLLVFLAISLLGLGDHAMAAPHRCAKPVTAKMAQLDISPSQIKLLVFADIVEDDRSARLIGYDAWVDLKQCRGSVVVKMSRQCEVEEIYSRGACAIRGLKNYP
jgi:hypothetical protein